MNWLWIDPGETVGWARGTTVEPIYDVEVLADSRPDFGLRIEDYGQHKSKTFVLQLLQSAANYDLIGYESYAIRQSSMQAHVGSNVPTLQVIGQIRLCGWVAQAARKDGLPYIVSQRPTEKSTGKAAMQNYVSPSMMVEINNALSGAHDEGHYGDALLHAIAWHHHNITHTKAQP